jgi:hypothetical protein
MPTAEQLRQFLVLTVLPVVAGATANWLVIHVHLLASFHITATAVGSVVSQLGVFGITAAITFLASHHILSGHYTPAAKLKARS